MFGGDPFGGNPFQQMHRQMREMDNLMDAMMGDMFGGMMGGPSRRQMQQQAPQDHHPRDNNRHHRNQQLQMHDPHQQMLTGMMPFGGGGLFGGGLFGGIMQQMEHMHNHAINDPNSMVFTESTMISFDEEGQPKMVQNSTRKVGDVKENRRKVQLGEELEEMTVGHSIGDRSHIIEKKRDKDGRLRQTQQFVGLEPEDARRFNDDFERRAQRNLRNVAQAGRAVGSSLNQLPQHRAIGAGRGGGESSAPIVTVPDDDDDEDEVTILEETHHNRNNRRDYHRGHYPTGSSSSRIRDGPIIREISDEEAEKSEAPKRRKNLFGKYV